MIQGINMSGIHELEDESIPGKRWCNWFVVGIHLITQVSEYISQHCSVQLEHSNIHSVIPTHIN